MKKMKVLMAALLSVTVVLGAVVPANAASTDVEIKVEATDMDKVSVTVPSTLPIIFNADGTNTLPSNWTIENNSTFAGIHVSQITLDAEGSGWKLLGELERVADLTADTKAMKLSIGSGTVMEYVQTSSGTASETGSATYGDTDISIGAGESTTLTFDVERGAFTTTEPSAKAFEMVLTFEFN